MQERGPKDHPHPFPRRPEKSTPKTIGMHELDTLLAVTEALDAAEALKELSVTTETPTSRQSTGEQTGGTPTSI